MVIRLSALLFVISTLCFLLPSDVFAKDSAPGASASAVASGSPADAANGANLAELQMLMQNAKLLELRTTFNGSYGASLLLDENTRIYYTASFQHKIFFRVFKNRSEKNAENHYRKLSAWTEDQSKAEIAHIKNP